jgi:hypothetical protein
VADLDKRVRGVEYYIKALRSGEGSAARQANSYLAADATATIGKSVFKGRDDVTFHITGEWPNVPVYRLGGWSDPIVDGDTLVVSAEFPPFGAGANSGTVTFSFNDGDEIAEVTEVYVNNPPATPSTEIPLIVRGAINGALANGTPLCVAYVNEKGEPVQSLRGSVMVWGDNQLAAWLRNEDGGLASSLAKNPNVSMLYRDSKLRSTITVKGLGHIEQDEAIKQKVWEMSPEVEQMHTPQRQGACLIIDIKEIRGSTTQGAVNVQL